MDLLQFPPPISDDDYRINAYIDSTTKAVIMANLVGLFVVLGSWGYYRKFLRRDVEGTDKTNMEEVHKELEKALSIMGTNDSHSCGQRLICEVHAKSGLEEIGKTERNIIATFRYMNSSLHPHSIVSAYKKAAILGKAIDSGACRTVYHSCQLQPNDLANIIAAANRLAT